MLKTKCVASRYVPFEHISKLHSYFAVFHARLSQRCKAENICSSQVVSAMSFNITVFWDIKSSGAPMLTADSLNMDAAEQGDSRTNTADL